MKKTYISPISELSLLSVEDILLASLNVSDEFGSNDDQGGMDWNYPTK